MWCDLQSPEGGKTPVLVADSLTFRCKCYRRRPGLVTNTWFYCYKLAADVQTFSQKYQFCQNTNAAADVQIHLQKHQTQQEMFRGLVNTPRFIGCRRTLHANNHHCCRQNYDWKGFVKNIHTTRDLVKNISNHDSQGINTSRLIEMSTRYVDDDFCDL